MNLSSGYSGQLSWITSLNICFISLLVFIFQKFHLWMYWISFTILQNLSFFPPVLPKPVFSSVSLSCFSNSCPLLFLLFLQYLFWLMAILNSFSFLWLFPFSDFLWFRPAHILFTSFWFLRLYLVVFFLPFISPEVISSLSFKNSWQNILS